jgi:hypothetical protein
MSGGQPPGDTRQIELLNARLAEYNALRAELVNHIQYRYRFTEVTLVTTAAVLGIGLSSEDLAPILLVYPIFVAIMYVSWVSSGFVIIAIAGYIRERIEAEIPVMGWEHYVVAPDKPWGFFGMFGTWGVVFLFIVTETVAMVAGIFLAQKTDSYSALEIGLTILGVVGIVATLTLVVRTVPRLERGEKA